MNLEEYRVMRARVAKHDQMFARSLKNRRKDLLRRKGMVCLGCGRPYIKGEWRDGLHGYKPYQYCPECGERGSIPWRDTGNTNFTVKGGDER